MSVQLEFMLKVECSFPKMDWSSLGWMLLLQIM